MDVKILILAAVCQLSVGAPVSGFPLDYQPGKSYTYTYTTETRLNDPGLASSPRATSSQAYGPVGFRLSATLELNPIWQKGNQMLVKFAMNMPQLQSVSREQASRELQGLPRLPVYFLWEAGRVVRVFASEEDNTLAINIKKGAISLFQIQLQNSVHTELDSSGECRVQYTQEGSTISKVKSSCESTDIAGQFFNINPMLGTSVERSSTTNYKLVDNIIMTSHSAESFESRLNLHQQLATDVQMSQVLEYKSSTKGLLIKGDSADAAMKNIMKINEQTYHGSTLETMFEVRQCTQKCSTFSEKVTQHRDQLTSDKVSSTEAAAAFLQLVQACRSSPKAQLTESITHYDNQNIVPQLLDVLTACQTTAAQEVAMEILNFSDEYYIEQPERYLLGIALGTHPKSVVLENLLELHKKQVPSEKLRESILGGLGAVVRTHCGVGEQCKSKIVQEIQSTLVEGLENCDAEADPSCRPMHVRALSNAGLPETIPLLLKYAEESTDCSVSESAIKAVIRMGQPHIARKEVREVMKRIFHEERQGYDTAVRSQALAVILQTNPTQEEVKAILSQSTDPWNTEFDTYIQARLFNYMEQHPQIRSHVVAALKDTNISNYHILAPKGKSLAFTSPLAKTDSIEADYFMYVENSKAGIMKRSGLDVQVYSDKGSMPIYSFAMFSAGMEGLLGKELEPGSEDVVPTAGLALDLTGVSLRPITFFTGQSGLMSAVWNAPSEPISALQANVMLQDHSQRVHLGNGLIVEHVIQGALSLDLSGSLSVSLWNKNAKCLIRNSGAVVMQGKTKIASPSFRTEVNFNAESASVINFKTDVDFYDGVKSCLQMGRPSSDFKHTVRKYESAKRMKTGLKLKVDRSQKCNNLSYPLPKPNNEECRRLNPES